MTIPAFALSGPAIALALLLPGLILVVAAAWYGERRHRRHQTLRLILQATEEDPRVLAITRNEQLVRANAAFRNLIDPQLDAIDLLDELAALAQGGEALDQLRMLAAGAAAGSSGSMEADLGLTSGRTGRYRIEVAAVSGQPGMARWTLEDVTAAHQLHAIREEEHRLMEDFLDNLPVGFFSADGEGRFLYVNRPLANRLGISLGDIQEHHLGLADFIAHVEEGDDMEALSAEEGDHGLVMLRDGAGEPFKAFLYQSERTTRTGDFLYSRSLVLWEFLDQAALGGGGGRNWEWLFRALFAESPVGIVQLDPNGVVVNCNRAFLKLLGLHREGVLDRPLAERVVKENRDALAAELGRVLAGRTLAAVFDLSMPAAGGRTVAATVYANRIDDLEGRPVGTALHFIDTTERKQLEAQFTQSQKVQAVGQLAGGIAHDFNNLLTAMIGFCDLLLGRVGPGDPSFSDIMQIKQNANRAANLVRQLLAFSRRQTLQPEIINITHALGDLTNLINRLIGEKIQLRLEHGRDLKPVKVDPGQLDQVIVNLAVNARDAMPAGGVLSISTRMVTLDQPLDAVPEAVPPGRYLRLDVADAGQGIRPGDLGRIFEPFFSTTEEGSGTGLGLSTVYGIIRQTGGYITVRSEMGVGSTFSLFLPPSEEQGRPSTDAGRAKGKPDTDLTGNATVLLVEDEDAVRLFASRALTNKGYKVLEAENGENALRVLRDSKSPIDLVISDIVMPGMDGHALVRELRAARPDLKVILISGYSEDALPEEIGTDKTLHFLNKPFSLDTLAGKVKEVLDA